MTHRKIYKLKNFRDERGSLVSIESSSSIPFDIKRIYYIFGNKKNVIRGFHAHKKLHQVAICVTGSCKMILDNGKRREEFILNSKFEAVDLPPMIWHEMQDFSEDCVLLVLASDYYSEDDYVRDYEKYLEIILS